MQVAHCLHTILLLVKQACLSWVSKKGKSIKELLLGNREMVDELSQNTLGHTSCQKGVFAMSQEQLRETC